MSAPKDTTTRWTTTLPLRQHDSKDDYENLQSFKCLTIEMEKNQRIFYTQSLPHRPIFVIGGRVF